MILQSGLHDCGPAAVANACEALGLTISLEIASRVCGTTWEGTDHEDIIRGLNALGYNPVEVTEYVDLMSHLWQGRPVICYTENDHWVAVIGRLGCRLNIADSMSEQVVRSISASEWMKEWRTSDGFYGLALAR